MPQPIKTPLLDKFMSRTVGYIVDVAGPDEEAGGDFTFEGAEAELAFLKAEVHDLRVCVMEKDLRILGLENKLKGCAATIERLEFQLFQPEGDPE